MKLIATKPFTYATRRLQPGDSLQVGVNITRNDARLLLAIKKVRPDEEDRPVGALPPPPAGLVERTNPVRAGAEDLTDLRGRYFQVVGKRPFNGWDAETLRAKIAAAGAS